MYKLEIPMGESVSIDRIKEIARQKDWVKAMLPSIDRKRADDYGFYIKHNPIFIFSLNEPNAFSWDLLEFPHGMTKKIEDGFFDLDRWIARCIELGDMKDPNYYINLMSRDTRSLYESHWCSIRKYLHCTDWTKISDGLYHCGIDRLDDSTIMALNDMWRNITWGQWTEYEEKDKGTKRNVLSVLRYKDNLSILDYSLVYGS